MELDLSVPDLMFFNTQSEYYDILMYLTMFYVKLKQRSKLTFSKSRLLATFYCKMVAIKKFQSPKTKKPEGEDTS